MWCSATNLTPPRNLKTFSEPTSPIEPNNMRADQKKRDNDVKILVLDLDETLIHSSFDNSEHYDFEACVTIGNSCYSVFIQKRPGVDEFLQVVLENFDVFIFTASISEYSSSIVSKLIPGFPVEKILTREHCKYLNGNFIKELSLFGKDLSQVIIVDDKAVSFCLNPSNGIIIPTWDGDENDNKLIKDTLPLLEKCFYADDVRTVINQSKCCRRRGRSREW